MRAGSLLGAFSGGQLVGIGVVVPHLRPAIAQLAFLHVSEAFRAAGIGSRLCDDLELMARDAGDSRDGRLGDAVGEHGALLPGSRLRAHGPAAAGALRARARGRAHAKGAVRPAVSPTSETVRRSGSAGCHRGRCRGAHSSRSGGGFRGPQAVGSARQPASVTRGRAFALRSPLWRERAPAGSGTGAASPGPAAPPA